MLARRIRPTTLDLYQGLWSRHIAPGLGRRAIASISRLEVEEFGEALSASGVGAATTGASLRLLHRIMASAVDGGLIGANPARRVGQPSSPHSETRFLSPEEVERLIQATPDRWKPFVMLAAWCGLRFGEISALKLERVDFKAGRIRVEETLAEVSGKLHVGPPKNKANRAVAAPPFVLEAIADHVGAYPRGPGGLVFAAPRGGHVRRTNFRNRVWVPAIREAGVEPLRFHDLRHTAVALAIAAGGHAKAIQARLGHSSVSMTLDRYGHLMEGLDGDLAARLEFLHRTAWRRPGEDPDEGPPKGPPEDSTPDQGV